MKVLFVDLDGTLADTIPELKALFPGPPEEFEAFNGSPLGEIMQAFGEDYEESIASLYREVPLFPQAAETLLWAKRKGIRLFLVTSATKRLAHFFLDTHGLTPLFEGVMTADGIAGKPSPEIYERALKLAGVAPSEAIAIEDSPNGLTSARQAGIAALPFKNWQEVKDRLSDV